MEGSLQQFKITIHGCVYDCVHCTRCVMQVRWSGRQTSPPESIGKLWLCRLHSPSPRIIYRIGGRCRTITWLTVTMCWPRNPLVMPRTSEFFFRAILTMHRGLLKSKKTLSHMTTFCKVISTAITDLVVVKKIEVDSFIYLFCCCHKVMFLRNVQFSVKIWTRKLKFYFTSNNVNKHICISMTW